MEMIEPAQGIFLIAEPFLKDPHFMRTVVLLCAHNDEGTMGFVVNRKESFTLDEVMRDAKELPLPVYYGGPVRPDILHFLHQCPDKIPGSQQVSTDIFWGGDYETAITLLRQGLMDASQIRFFIGHSGWSSGQLSEEMDQHAWLTVAASGDFLFQKNEKELWKQSLRLLGGDFEQMAHYPTDPQLN